MALDIIDRQRVKTISDCYKNEQYVMLFDKKYKANYKQSLHFT